MTVSLLVQIKRELNVRLPDEVMASLLKSEESPEFLLWANHYKHEVHEPYILDLSSTPIFDKQLELLKDFPCMGLKLRDCPNLTNDCLTTVALFPHLKQLSLDMNQWVNDETLERIPIQIVQLSLMGCQSFDGSGLGYLGNTGVHDLNLFYCDQLTDADLEYLSKNIEVLNLLGNSNIDTKCMRHLHELSHLHSLVLAETNIKTNQLRELPVSLSKLDLSGCDLNDEALSCITHLTHLHELFLTGLNITDLGLRHIPEEVLRLGLSRCLQITDKGMESLAKRRALKTVHLYNCPRITSRGVKMFASDVHVGWQDASLRE